jgi:hypothetical protein
MLFEIMLQNVHRMFTSWSWSLQELLLEPIENNALRALNLEQDKYAEKQTKLVHPDI